MSLTGRSLLIRFFSDVSTTTVRATVASTATKTIPKFKVKPKGIAKRVFKPFNTLVFFEKLRSDLISSQANLTATNHHYLRGGGKALRPSILLHLAQCLKRHQPNSKQWLDEMGVLPKQRRLTEIVEMIHTASLLHDDVIDEAMVRRGSPAANVVFGAKSAILSGDYMLAQASLALAELGCLPVIRMLATVLKDLVEGEMLQMNASISQQLSLSYYLEKSYLKTASLIAKSCEGIACLGGHPEATQKAAYEFGKNLGLAFQVIDDKLDFTATPQELGKEVGSDLGNKIITAPVLFAVEEYPIVKDIIGREFSGGQADYAKVMELVRGGRAIEKTQELADSLLKKSLDALSFIPARLIDESFSNLIASVTLRSK